jgi:hypothetical protein
MCGVVMQDGFIFGDTIANNIAIGQEDIDGERLIQAAKIAQIHDFISNLALGYNTKIGSEGSRHQYGTKTTHPHRPGCLQKSRLHSILTKLPVRSTQTTKMPSSTT